MTEKGTMRFPGGNFICRRGDGCHPISAGDDIDTIVFDVGNENFLSNR